MKKIFLSLLVISVAFLTHAQTEKALKYASEIDSVQLKNTLAVLSAEKMGGRETATKGNQMAAIFITDYMKQVGIRPGNKTSYFQDLKAYQMQNAQKKFMINNFNYQNDYTYGNNPLQDPVIVDNEIIFAGYGIYSASYNDFENIDISNKVVMFMEGGSPCNRFGINYAQEKQSTYSTDYVFEKKPKAILLVRNNYNQFLPYKTNRLVFREEQQFNKPIPEITINEMLANRILSSTNKSVKQIQYEIELSGKSSSFSIKTPFSIHGNYVNTPVNATNVIGFIEGSDLKDEYVVLCAHFDHENENINISNGANKNASGVSAAMEIARVLNKARREGNGPRRSVIILLTNAKEKGLYGSSFYLNNPVFPLEKTIACINIDQLGSTNRKYSRNKKNYMYAVSHKELSKELMNDIDYINSLTAQMVIDKRYTYPQDQEGYIQMFDQYNFIKKEIPAVSFTNASHDDSSTTEDIIDYIDFNRLTERTKLIFLLLWEQLNK